MSLTVAQLLVLGLLISITSASAPKEQDSSWCTKTQAGPGLPEFSLLYECPSVPPVILIPYLWQPVQINIKCPSSWYSVYTALDEASLKQKLKSQEVSWCGFDSLLDGSICSLQVSPFSRTLVAVKGVKGCTITSSASTSQVMLWAGLAGILLFYASHSLTSSQPFRLGAGTAVFTAGSLLILMVIVFRLMPQKRAVAAVFTAAGSSGLALVRYLTGQWLPSWHQLVTNRIFGIYVVASAMIGAIATYLYDDIGNPKVNTVIKAMLRSVALLLVYFSTWTLWPVSATVMGIMVASLIGPGVARGVQQTGARVHQAAQATHRILVTPFSAKRRPRVSAATTPAQPAGRTPQFTQQYLQQQQQQQGGLSGQHRYGAEVDRLSPREYDDLTPVHLKTPPPAPWEVQPRRRVSTFEEQMARAVVQQGPTTRGSTRSTRRGTVARSPLDFVQTSGPSASMLGESDEEEASQQHAGSVSQLVRSGYILNPESGRLIKIGGDVYNRLLEQGYEPDVAAGALVAVDGSYSGRRKAPASGRSRLAAGSSRRS